MTEQELHNIRRIYETQIEHGFREIVLARGFFEELFKAAERAQILESRREYEESCLQEYEERIPLLLEEIVRLRKALEFYAVETKYMYKSQSLKGHPEIINDKGDTARQALRGDNNA